MSAQGEPASSEYLKVLRFVRRRTASAEDAEDVTQEVFANAAAELERTGADAPTLAWLYTVARRRIADEARRHNRSRTVALRAVDSVARENSYGEAVAQTLQAGLATMPEGQRRVVVGRLLRGCSFAELGRELDTSEEACRMRFTRGLQHLREEFEKEGLEP